MRGTGRAMFTAFLLLFVGTLNIFYGIGALSNAHVYVGETRLVFGNLHTYGWVLLILAAIQLTGGVSLLAGNAYGRVIGIIAASLGGLSNLTSIGGNDPWWRLGAFALYVYILYGLIVFGQDVKEAKQAGQMKGSEGFVTAGARHRGACVGGDPSGALSARRAEGAGARRLEPLPWAKATRPRAAPRDREVPADLYSGGSSLLLGLRRLTGTGRPRSLHGPAGCISMNTDVPEFAQSATAGVVNRYGGLAVSPDGRQIYAGTYPGGIAASLVTGEPASSLNCRHPVSASTPRGTRRP